jgi:hypothetical protein
LGAGGGGSGADGTSVHGGGGNGGKGVIILRTAENTITATFTGGTLTTTGGFKIYTFNDSGTINWSQ